MAAPDLTATSGHFQVRATSAHAATSELQGHAHRVRSGAGEPPLAGRHPAHRGHRANLERQTLSRGTDKTSKLTNCLAETKTFQQNGISARYKHQNLRAAGLETRAAEPVPRGKKHVSVQRHGTRTLITALFITVRN